MHRAVLALALALPLVCAADAAPVPAGKPLLLWDGDKLATGSGWAKGGGDGGKPETAVGTVEGGTGKVVHMHAEAEYVTRQAWRWTEPGGSPRGTNAKDQTHFCFRIRVTGQVMPQKIAVALASFTDWGTSTVGPEIDISTYSPKVLGGGKNWIAVSVPLDVLTASGCDRGNLDEARFAIQGPKGLNADIYLDDFAFIKAK